MGHLEGTGNLSLSQPINWAAIVRGPEEHTTRIRSSSSHPHSLVSSHRPLVFLDDAAALLLSSLLGSSHLSPPPLLYMIFFLCVCSSTFPSQLILPQKTASVCCKSAKPWRRPSTVQGNARRFPFSPSSFCPVW
ncbi:hypothetical protein ABZP36_013551 [Zizania latifolia]